MEYDKKDYNPELHDKYICLSLPQPQADRLTIPTFQDDEGFYQADQTIIVRTRNTKYRGEILICSSAKPVLEGHISGCTCGLVELYDIKPVEELTEKEWVETCIEFSKRPRKGYAYLVKNPRRVVEMPIKGKLGMYEIVLTKDEICEYPTTLAIDQKGIDMIQKRLKK